MQYVTSYSYASESQANIGTTEKCPPFELTADSPTPELHPI